MSQEYQMRWIPAAFAAKGKVDYDEALKLSIQQAMCGAHTVKDLQVFTAKDYAQ